MATSTMNLKVLGARWSRAGATQIVASEELGSKLAFRDPEPSYCHHARLPPDAKEPPSVMGLPLTLQGSRTPYQVWYHHRTPRAPYQEPWERLPGMDGRTRQHTDTSLFLSPIPLSLVTQQESTGTDEEHLSSIFCNHLAESLA